MSTDDRTLRKGDSPKSRVLEIEPDAICRLDTCNLYVIAVNGADMSGTLSASAWDSWRMAEDILDQ